MRSVDEVEDRIRQVVTAEFRSRLDRDVLPHLCVNNHRQPLDHRRTVYDEANTAYNRITVGVSDESGLGLPVIQTIGLCMLGAETPDTWPGTICEEPLDAQRCPYFEYRRSRAEVYERLAADLRNPLWVAARLPEVHSLLWVLGASLQVEKQPAHGRLWAWLLRLFSRKVASEKSVGVLVYLPALDALAEEDRPRTTPDH